MQLAGAVGAFLRIGIFDAVKMNFIQPDPGCIPVMRISFHDDGLARLPIRQGEGSVADQPPGLGPVGVGLVEPTVFFHRAAMHRIPGPVAQQEEEVGGRMREFDAQSAVVQGADTNRRKIRRGGRREFLGSADVVIIITKRRTQRGRQDAAGAEDEIMGRDGVAVGPAGVTPQVKDIDQSVRRDFPFFGHAGHDMQVLRVVTDQPFAQGHEDIEVRLELQHVRVQILRFRRNALMEDLDAVASLDSRLAFRATRGQQQAEGSPDHTDH